MVYLQKLYLNVFISVVFLWRGAYLLGPTAISSTIAQSKLDYSQGFCQWESFKYQRAVIITGILDLTVVANDQLESSERLSH